MCSHKKCSVGRHNHPVMWHACELMWHARPVWSECACHVTHVTIVTCAMCDMQYMRHVWHAIHVTHVWHAIHVTCVTWHATCVLTDVTQVISIVSTPLCPFHCHNSPQKPQNSVHKRFMSRQMLPTLVWFISLPLFSFKFINLLPALTRRRRRTLLPTLKQYQTSLNKVRQVISFLPDSNK